MIEKFNGIFYLILFTFWWIGDINPTAAGMNSE